MLLGLILIQDINKEDKKEEEEMEIKSEMTFVIDTKMIDPETNTMIDTMTNIMIDTMKGMITKETEIMEEIDTAEDNKMMTKDTIDKEVQGIRIDPNRRSNLMKSSID
jgi:nucleosome binding factor SPN SPT16 subunit